jgi:hypothetical protein
MLNENLETRKFVAIHRPSATNDNSYLFSFNLFIEGFIFSNIMSIHKTILQFRLTIFLNCFTFHFLLVAKANVLVLLHFYITLTIAHIFSIFHSNEVCSV